MRESRHKGLLTLIFGLLLVGGIWVFWNNKTPNASEPSPTAQWEVASYENGITLHYPKRLPTAYIDAIDWPPMAQVLSEPFTCTEGGEEGARAGITERKEIQGTPYCVTRVTEGAAGSIYTMYAYAFEKGGETVILTFSTRAIQCGNFSDTEKAACEEERAGFDTDSLIDQIANTIQ